MMPASAAGVVVRAHRARDSRDASSGHGTANLRDVNMM